MSREILFKAKRKDNNQWIEGCLLQTKEYSDGVTVSYIKPKGLIMLGLASTPSDTFIEVITETVCQYIGIVNTEGKNVFEGDKVEAWSTGSKGTFEVRWRQEGSPTYILYPAWKPFPESGKFWKIHGTYDSKLKEYIDDLKIIGNIHD